jgi:SAM-dependent methyltransferase
VAAHPDADEQRAEMLARWERAAPGWGRQAAKLREWAMPVSAWMLEQLTLQPGQRVLELAAGPGDTGFLAAELVGPFGALISSDASEAMVSVARERARALGVENVEFRRLELEWIDLETASVDAVLCRWALMLCLDPPAALHEIRRVVRPGGRFALAVWDEPSANPWATIPGRALINLGHSEPPDPDAPGMFALAAPGRLGHMLADAGFVDVFLESVPVDLASDSVGAFLEDTIERSMLFAAAWEPLSEDERAGVAREIARLAQPFTAADGTLLLPGRSLLGAASA